MAYLFVLLLGVSGPATARPPEKPAPSYTIPLPPRPDYSALDWLIGEWQGKTAARSPQGEVHLTVESALDKRFLIFHEEVTLAATSTAPAVHEAWMGILSVASPQPGFVLRTFSDKGFIIRYRVTIEGPEIHLSPEGGDQPPPGWLFRRTILRSGEAELKETVEAAPPRNPFFEYYTATLSRVTRTGPTH